jgi:hypothetical protein
MVRKKRKRDGGENSHEHSDKNLDDRGRYPGRVRVDRLYDPFPSPDPRLDQRPALQIHRRIHM